MVHETKCKFNSLSYFSDYSKFRLKKLETKSTTKKQEDLKNGKMRFRLNSDVRKEKEDSWLNAIKTKLGKRRLNFSRKTV